MGLPGQLTPLVGSASSAKYLPLHEDFTAEFASRVKAFISILLLVLRWRVADGLGRRAAGLVPAGCNQGEGKNGHRCMSCGVSLGIQ